MSYASVFIHETERCFCFHQTFELKQIKAESPTKYLMHPRLVKS